MMRAPLPRLLLLGLALGAGPAAAQPLRERLCELAAQAVSVEARQRGGQAEVQCRAADALSVATEGWTFEALAPGPNGLRAGAMTWAVRARQADGRSRVFQVPLTVHWILPTWVSARALPAQTLIGPDDLLLKPVALMPGEALPPQAAHGAQAAEAPHGRLREALRAGEPVSTRRLLPADWLPAGHRLTLVMSEGGLQLQLPGRLVAGARVGEPARAQARGRREVFEGRLLDASTLWIGSQG